MNQVIANYFDDAHRGLQKQRPEHPPRSFVQNVQLPPLHTDSGSPGASMSFAQGEASGSWEKPSPSGSARMRQSNSVGALEFGSSKAGQGVRDQRFQQALEENSRLGRKLRQLQDQLSITSAKKEAFKVQATRLEKEFKKGREQTDSLQKDLLDAKRESEHYAKESQEAVQMMNEMRRAHLQEVRLLQRGLQARGGDEKFRNRVNEVADLVDKLGRAVVQRDEAVRDKIKAVSQTNKMTNDLRAVVDECSKLRRQNKSLEARLREAIRKGKYKVPRPEVEVEEDSDPEFEDELSQFEKRFEILEEGPMGLDILASKLSAEKQRLEKLAKQQAEELQSTGDQLGDWKKNCEIKDKQIQDLNAQVEKLLLDSANLQDAIDRKRIEIEEQVNGEIEKLQRQVEERTAERDEARDASQAMEIEHTRVSQELVKVHEQYEEMQQKKMRNKQELAGAMAQYGDDGEPEAEAAPVGELTDLAEEFGQQAKTGEEWHLTVQKDSAGNHYVLVDQGTGGSTRVRVPEQVVEDLDPADEWVELFGRVGTNSSGRVVISELIARREVGVPPAGLIMLISIYKYDNRRFFFQGMDMSHPDQHFEALTTEETIPAEIASKIDASETTEEMVGLLLEGLSFQSGELHF
mmetsp:Transcript_147110/g.256728  ORF Transcript_147110/g.256728 Transcript_147110/m.256728 type:complete len:634 (+) Transcript_147110:164-2065(+)